MKKNRKIVIGLVVLIAVGLIYGYLYEFPVRAHSTEFELVNLEIVNDTIIVEVDSSQSGVIFKRINFDTYGGELQLRIEKVRNKSFRTKDGYGYFRLEGNKGRMEKTDRIIIKYEDKDIEIWTKSE